MLSASATNEGVVPVLLVEIAHKTSVGKSAVSQLGSLVGSVALPTVICKYTVEVS